MMILASKNGTVLVLKDNSHAPEKCRTAADSMETEAARRWFLQLARSYEALAEHAEKEVREREVQDRDTG
jgi:hypothetical protein